MPTIEITQAQQDALDAGQAITIQPEPPVLHVVVHAAGSVYMTRGPLDDAEWRIIRNARDFESDTFKEWQAVKFDFTKYPDSYTPVLVKA